MKSLHKFRHGLDTVLSWVCALLFAAMVVVGTYQIVTRYFFGRPSTVSEELLTYSFTWMALLSSALVFGKRDHMRMGFWPIRSLAPRARCWRSSANAWSCCWLPLLCCTVVSAS